MSSRTDCRKFAPNIFNKSKCTNCFRQKEEHSAEALECNRASRKVSKCGYLFVAPGWDFSDPLNRTKRWQRRWFVLYDDGELNYSVDEHPDTVPQAVVDMNQVLEVSGAEDVTGHTFSIAITAPDRVHFVKATCREEARWWSDVLSVFTRSKGRHKRNATFPGGQSTTIIQAPQATVRSGTPNPIRPRYNSCHTESTVTSLQRSWGGSSLQTPTAIADTVPTRDTTPPSSLPQQPLQGQSESVRSPANSPALVESRTVYKDQPASSASPPTRDKINSEEKARCRRDKRSAKINNLDWLDTCRQRQDSISKREKDAETQSTAEQQHLMLLDEYEQQTKRDEKLKDIAAVLTRPRVRRPTPSPVPISASHQQQQQPTRDTPSSRQQDEIDASTTEKLLRGDPDGCGLDLGVHHHQHSQRYSPNSELRVDLPAEDLLHIRKGWLSKRAHDQQWNRHWFVLHGAALKYYRDPSAEDRGIMDGVIDLNGVTSVSELQLTRNFGFQLVLWEESCFLLSAVTAGVRNNWISVIKRAAGLSESSDTVESSDITMIEKEPIVPTTPITPITPRSMLFSSDEEYRTASEGGRRESGEWCEPLPPSPPLTRTPISRVKERARSRSSSGSRICKRSRSSPPSSRRSTIDSVKTDDLILPCCGEELPEVDSSLVEMLESEVKELRERLENSQNEAMNNNLTHIVEKQANEIEDLKKQLNNALNEINNTEKEVARLRQIKTEAKLREKRMEELLATLENTERQLNERAEDMEMLKQMYGQDKELWENRLAENELLLRDATERCELLSGEVTAGRHTVEQLQNELSALSERLAKGIDENDALYKRICELEGKSSGLRMSKDKTRSVDSLSDLTNIDLDLDFHGLDKERVIEEYDELRSRFEKAVQEIRAMKKELRESHIVYDELELTNIKLRQDMKLREESDESQVGLMAARIQDLTLKLTASDKQVRTLKQKLQDSREKRRSLSLKGGRESFSIGKEVEEKLSELESKISALESGRPVIGKALKHSPKRDRSIDRQSPINDRGLKRMSARLRRKSLDTATSSEPMKVLIRLSSLESKVSSISENIASPDVLLSPTEENAVSIATSSESLNQLDASTVSISDSEMTPRLQILENVVSSARDKVNECLCQLSLLKSSRSKRSPSPIDRRFDGVRSIEKCLSELGNLLRDGSSENGSFTRSVSNAEINAISESVKSVVKSLEHVLRTKLQEIASRRIVLRKDGKLDNKMYLQLLAEKLAYESVIVGRIHDTLNSTGCYDNTLSSRLMKAEIVETSHLLSNLKRKLAGKCPKRQYGSKLSIDYLTKVLANKLIKTGHITSQVSPNESPSSQIKNSVSDKMVNYLISKRDEVNVALTLYKTTKLEQLANALASETLSYISEKELPQEKYSPLNELKIREAWQIAQETVNNELIQSEITHVMMRCAQNYETTIATDHDAFFSFYASERASLELWADAVEDKLREAMTENLKELSEAYESCLTKLRRQSRGQWKQQPEQDHAMNESRELLAEFADITAHKALVDARISVLSSELKQSEFSNAEKEDSTVESLMQDDMFISSLSDNDFHINNDCMIDAEFQFLYQHYSRECRAVIGSEPLTSQDKAYIREVVETLVLIEKELNKIEKYVGQNNNSDDEVTDNEISSVEVTDWNSVCGKCSNLHHRIVELTACVLQRQNCKQCEQLQDTVHRLSSEHEEKVRVLQRSQEASLGELRGALENERASQAQLRERARRLEKRLGTLDSEYSQQVESLRAAYNMTLTTAGLDRGLQGEENVRQRYQAEIEQLRALCEKGLVAMESSHRRVISELEDKHRREREQLRLEKEQALAEETQATLAALDAMRKAHESEVQREITKFKAEFIKKMQSTHDIGALHQEHQEQMEEIKKEILSLSEKYSVKCVESAALEEQLAKLSNQLAQAQQHIMQLDSRNKQLRAHLISDGNDMNICSSSRRERDDTGRLQKQLHATKMHGDRLVAVCIALRASRTNGALTPDCPLWDELHRLTGSWHHVTCTGVLVGSASGGSSVQEQCVTSRNTQFSEPSALSIAELIRFPKLPMRSEPPLLNSVHRQPSPGPLAGMVAERKKRFELTK